MWMRTVIDSLGSPIYQRAVVTCGGVDTTWDSHAAYDSIRNAAGSFIGYDASKAVAYFHLTGMVLRFLEVLAQPGCSGTGATWGGSWSFPVRDLAVSDAGGATVTDHLPRFDAPLFNLAGYPVVAAVWPGDHAVQGNCLAVKAGQSPDLTLADCIGSVGAGLDLSSQGQDDIFIVVKTRS